MSVCDCGLWHCTLADKAEADAYFLELEAERDRLRDGLERLAQSYGPESAVAVFARQVLALPEEP